MGRKTRFLVMRCLLICLFLGVLYLVYESFALAARTQGSRLSAEQLARFGEAYFGYFLITQYAVIMLITPAYVAGAIAEEKERRTLEFMLATDLGNQEIVLGKFVARLANVVLFLLAGLPVLSMVQLFGGISPELLWSGFVATLVTVISLTSVSILMSVLGRRVRDALLYAYLLLIGYFLFWGFLELARGFLSMDPPAPPAVLATMDLLLEAYKAGNPFVAVYKLSEHVQNTGSLGWKPIELLIEYCLFHGTLAIACLLLAILMLRRVYVRQAFGGDKRMRTQPAPVAKSATPARKQPPPKVRIRPPVWDNSMLWKELYCERGLRLGVIGQTLMILFAIVVLAPGAIILGVTIVDFLRGAGSQDMWQEGMNQYVRTVGLFLFSLVMIGVGLRAALSIGSERDRQTLEGLLASPLSLKNILFAKWLGSIGGLRAMYFVLGIAWLMGVLAGGIHPLALWAMIVSLAVFSAFAASLGLYFAASVRTTLRAVIGTLLVLLALGAIPWVASNSFRRGDSMRALSRSLSPLFVLYFDSFSWHDVDRDHVWGFDDDELFGSTRPPMAGRSQGSLPLTLRRMATPLLTVVSVTLYALTAALLWYMAVLQFRKSCGRMTLLRPRGPPLKKTDQPHVERAE